MSTELEMQRLAEALSHEQLVGHWGMIKSGRTPEGFTDRGRALEYCILRAFQLELEGQQISWPCTVSWPPLRLGTVEQLDGVIYTRSGVFVIEAKAGTEPLNVEPLAKLRFRLEGRPPGLMGLVFSLSGFTTPAKFQAQFATPLNILLWTKEDLDAALTRRQMFQGLERKLRRAIEQRIPDYALDVEEDAA